MLMKLFLRILRRLLLLLNSVRSLFYFKPIQKGQHGESLVQFLRSSEINSFSPKHVFSFDGSYWDLVIQLQFLHWIMRNFPLNEHAIAYIILYYIILYYIILYYIISYRIVLYHIIYIYIIYHTISYIASYHIIIS